MYVMIIEQIFLLGNDLGRHKGKDSSMRRNKQHRWIGRLIQRITRKEQSCNDAFCLYRHLVVLQSGTTDYMDVMVYIGSDQWSGMLAEFSFDFWTFELNIECVEDDDLEEAIVRSFKDIYGRRVAVTTAQDDH